MIGTAKMLRVSLRLKHYSRGMVTANVIEPSYNAVMACDEQNRFAANVAGYVSARFAKLLCADDHVPGQ
jgi:hypothetical protein